jgi:hypothetical protein
MNPNTLPVPEKQDPSWYPSQKCYAKIGNIGCPCPKERPLLPEGISMQSLSVADRKEYMWMVPDEIKDHPMYKEDNYGERIIREDKEKKEQKENDKDKTLQALMKQVLDLTEAVNTLTKKSMVV